MRDGKASTAWVAGKGEGVGTTLAIAYTSPRHIAWVTLVTGHGTDTTKNATVARPTKVTLLWEGGEQAFTLADTRSPQDLALRGFARMSTLTLRVDEVSGPEGASVALSELAAYEPYEVISVKSRRRAKMTDAVEALRGESSPDAVASVVKLGERVIPWLIAELKRAELGASVRALQALQKIDRGRAWRVAFNTLEKGAAESAVAAAAYVASVGAKDLAEAVHGAYMRLEGAEKVAVLGSLAQLADPRALKVLIGGVRAGDKALMTVAGAHLASYGDDALFEIIALAGDPNAETRQRAVEVLIAWGGASALQALCDLANGPEQEAGLAVVQALSDAIAPIAEAALVSLASEPAGAIRDAALKGLIARGAASLSALIAFGAQSGPAVNARITDALGRSASPEVREALVDAVLVGGADVASRALQSALAKQGKAGIEAVLAKVIAAPERAFAPPIAT